MADIQLRLPGMKNWTAPQDTIHTYWVKMLTLLCERLVAQMNQLLKNGTHPEWLTEGRTFLIMKNHQKGTIPSNYRPIICLSPREKPLSGIIVAKISRHMDQYMIAAQKSIGKDTRGAKHQLVVDRTIAHECQSQANKPVHSWIDYKKAYESMPTWILEFLNLYKVKNTLRPL